MRSLQEWMKYLGQQEHSLQEAEQPSGDGRRTRAVSPPKTEEAPPPRAVESPPARPARPARKKTTHRAKPDPARSEIAQSSYQPFKETREELLQRLLDPLISLEEAARLLDVCPTTVRRYTNRGLLRHHRTAGNQRRFRLSDVLAFMESGGDGARTGYETDQKGR